MKAKIWCLVAAIGLATGGWLSPTAWSAKDNDSATADNEPATTTDDQNDSTADDSAMADDEPGAMPEESAAVSNPAAYLPVQVIPAEIDDPPFDRYIDLALLADAWERHDASLMIDAAIQLSEGERILQRPHRSISSAKLLELAAHIAAEKHDQALLERLHRLADQGGQSAWKSQLTSALKLAGEARAVDPNAAVSVDEMSPQMFAAIHGLKSQIEAARIAENPEALEHIQHDLASFKELPGKQRKYLEKLLDESRSALAHHAKPDTSDRGPRTSWPQAGRRRDSYGLTRGERSRREAGQAGR